MAVGAATAVKPAVTGTVVAPFSPTATDGDLVLVPAGANALMLRVINGSGGSINVTLDDPNSVSPANATAFNPDQVVAVGAGVTKTILVTDFARFLTSARKVLVTCSAVTTITIEATYV